MGMGLFLPLPPVSHSIPNWVMSSAHMRMGRLPCRQLVKAATMMAMIVWQQWQQCFRPRFVNTLIRRATASHYWVSSSLHCINYSLGTGLLVQIWVLSSVASPIPAPSVSSKFVLNVVLVLNFVLNIWCHNLMFNSFGVNCSKTAFLSIKIMGWNSSAQKM